MKLLIVIKLILLRFVFHNASLSDRLCSPIYPKHTDNVILVFLEFHETYDNSVGSCQNFINSTLADAVQVYKSIDEINLFIKTIGVRICDTCQNDYVAEILVTENINSLGSKKIICT